MSSPSKAVCGACGKPCAHCIRAASADQTKLEERDRALLQRLTTLVHIGHVREHVNGSITVEDIKSAIRGESLMSFKVLRIRRALVNFDRIVERWKGYPIDRL